MTKKITIPTAPFVLLIAILVLFGLLQPAFAEAQAAAADGERDANNMPVSVNIPIEYRMDGDASLISTDTYVLMAENDNNPMPAGSIGGKKRIEISKPGKADFGEMIMTKPGAYDYTVHRITTEKKNVTRDRTVYHVRIAALNTGEANLIIKREGDGNKSELIYRDTVKTSFFHSPKTGDLINPTILIMICAIAAVIIIFLLVWMRNRKFRS